MRSRNLIVGLAVAAWATAAQAESPTSIEFRYTPKVGQEMRHRMTMNSVGTMGTGSGVPGMRFTQSNTQEAVGVCKEVTPDGSAVFEITLGRVATRMNRPGMNFTFDSASFDPAKTDGTAMRMIGLLYSGLVGSKFTTTFNPQGWPVNVTGMREAVLKMIGPIKKEIDKDPAGRFVTPIIDSLAAAFDDSMINDQMKSFYRFLPSEAGPVAVGKKWDSDWDMELPFLKTKCKAKGQYELLGVETFRGHPCAKIGIKESFTMNTDWQRVSKSGTKPAAGLNKLFEKMDMSLSASNGEGVVHWDYEHGVLVQLRQTQRIAISIKFNTKDLMLAASAPVTETAPAGDQVIQTMTQNLTTSAQVDLLEGEADQTATRTATTGPADR